MSMRKPHQLWVPKEPTAVAGDKRDLLHTHTHTHTADQVTCK